MENSSERIIVSPKYVAGAVACWAIRQSPYDVPDNLSIVTDLVTSAFRGCAREDEFGFCTFADRREFERVLSQSLRSIPEYMTWNERKNGNDSPHAFTSRYDGPRDPDDDFIDLDALERNVANMIDRENIA